MLRKAAVPKRICDRRRAQNAFYLFHLQGDLIFIFISFSFLPNHQDFFLKKRKKIEHIDGFLHAPTLIILFCSKIRFAKLKVVGHNYFAI